MEISEESIEIVAHLLHRIQQDLMTLAEHGVRPDPLLLNKCIQSVLDELEGGEDET